MMDYASPNDDCKIAEGFPFNKELGEFSKESIAWVYYCMHDT
jgi:hypothetical protein